MPSDGSDSPRTGDLRALRGDGVVTIVLDRPHKRNALSRAMQVELCRLLANADQNGSVRAVILPGTDSAFRAGNDFTDTGQFTDRYGKRFWHHPAHALRAMGKPVICAVNGACVGGGLKIALSASFVVASERATFADPHARLDVVPAWGLTAPLPQAVGVRRAREMSLTGRSAPAAEAERIGLVNHVVPHELLLPFANQLAGRIPHTTAVRDVLRLYDREPAAHVAAASEWEQAVALEWPFDPARFAVADVARRGAEGTGE